MPTHKQIALQIQLATTDDKRKELKTTITLIVNTLKSLSQHDFTTPQAYPLLSEGQRYYRIIHNLHPPISETKINETIPKLQADLLPPLKDLLDTVYPPKKQHQCRRQTPTLGGTVTAELSDLLNTLKTATDLVTIATHLSRLTELDLKLQAAAAEPPHWSDYLKRFPELKKELDILNAQRTTTHLMNVQLIQIASNAGIPPARLKGSIETPQSLLALIQRELTPIAPSTTIPSQTQRDTSSEAVRTPEIHPHSIREIVQNVVEVAIKQRRYLATIDAFMDPLIKRHLWHQAADVPIHPLHYTRRAMSLGLTLDDITPSDSRIRLLPTPPPAEGLTRERLVNIIANQYDQLHALESQYPHPKTKLKIIQTNLHRNLSIWVSQHPTLSLFDLILSLKNEITVYLNTKYNRLTPQAQASDPTSAHHASQIAAQKRLDHAGAEAAKVIVATYIEWVSPRFIPHIPLSYLTLSHTAHHLAQTVDSTYIAFKLNRTQKRYDVLTEANKRDLAAQEFTLNSWSSLRVGILEFTLMMAILYEASHDLNQDDFVAKCLEMTLYNWILSPLLRLIPQKILKALKLDRSVDVFLTQLLYLAMPSLIPLIAWYFDISPWISTLAAVITGRSSAVIPLDGHPAPGQNPYQIYGACKQLNLTGEVTASDIKKGYRREALKHHSDKVPDQTNLDAIQAQDEKFNAIVNARDTLLAQCPLDCPKE